MSQFNSLIESQGGERREPYFVPDNESIPCEHFVLPTHYRPTLKALLVPHGVVMNRIEKLAFDIMQDYKGHTVHLCCVLKGISSFCLTQDFCVVILPFHTL
jgi:hypoxanthine phosphoribosyltransferase